jgi:hypothetical protein
MPNMSALDRCKHFGVANIHGMAYMPGPTDYREGSGEGTLYETSDFYNNIFEELWGSKSSGSEAGRKDLARFQQQLGVNFMHCYDWAAPVTQKNEQGVELHLREHLTFLAACDSNKMKATIPVSNYTMHLLQAGKTQDARKNFSGIIAEIYAGPGLPAAAGMWKIFNESDLDNAAYGNAAHVVTVMTWIAEYEGANAVADDKRLPVMVCTSFGDYGGTQPNPDPKRHLGASHLKDVRDILLQNGKAGPYQAEDFWNERIVFATNPQNPAADIDSYLQQLLPGYWKQNNVPVPPVMFTELGSNIDQAGSEQKQAEWLAAQIAASRPGASGGMMLGYCVFLNEERPWASGGERSFGITRFGADNDWKLPPQNYVASTKFPVWDPRGWWWGKDATYPVEQQAAKPNYQAARRAG